jgi:hypothetical protein
MMKDIIDRIDGKPQQGVDVTSNGKDIQTVLVKFLDDKSTNDNRDTK